jgi:homocysteine S-methyltransferase
MGTLIYAKGVPLAQSFDSLNLERPDLIREIHAQYIAAGARVIETNTFGANADFLARFGREKDARAISEAGARLAREAAAGKDVFVAGAIGPLSERSRRAGVYDDGQIRDIFGEQAEALANGGCDLLMLETFTSFEGLRLAYEAVRARTDLPVVAQMAFIERTGTLSGDEPITTLTEMWRMGADVVGVNCGRGPKLIVEIIGDFAPMTGHPLSAFFNAGSPDLVDGRYMYLLQPDYLVDTALRLVDLGVNLIGGCCGTTPEVIERIAQGLRDRTVRARPKVAVPPRRAIEVGAPPVFPPGFLEKPREEPSVIVELDPPRGMLYEQVIEGAKLMAQVGADMVSVAENPLASPRMGNVAMALLMKDRAGIEPLVHFTCRDRNLLGLQSDIMGAYALGLRHLLCVTGDPVPFGGEFGAKGVYDVVSFGLVQLVDGLNRGVNAAGASIHRPTRLRIGVAFSANVKHLHVQVERLAKKIGLGAQFVLTQPCWDPERIAETFAATKPHTDKLYLGCMPFASERNCEFLHSEVPGMTVPDEVRARMRGLSGKNGRAMGLKICEELIDVVVEHSHRLYIITPFNHYDSSARLREYFMERTRARVRRDRA